MRVRLTTPIRTPLTAERRQGHGCEAIGELQGAVDELDEILVLLGKGARHERSR